MRTLCHFEHTPLDGTVEIVAASVYGAWPAVYRDPEGNVIELREPKSKTSVRAMEQASIEQIRSMLIGVINNCFDRSLNTLAKAGMIDLGKLYEHYTGVGSTAYDLVTAQVGTDTIRSLCSGDHRTNTTSGPTNE